MRLTQILHSSFVAWGLAGLLMVMVVMLAFLRKRQLIGERLAILIIVAVMLLVLLALTVNIE
jgi:hypothetical protein